MGVRTYIKATEAGDVEQPIAKSNSYFEYQLIHMQKRKIVIINVYRPPDCPTDKFTSLLNELSTKLIEIGNRKPTIIFTGDLNFQIIDWQMETADGGTQENQVQANDFLQFAQEQCLQQYKATRKTTYILDVFLTKNDQLTRQIITRTSRSDHNIIQIETSIKIVEEKQKYQIKKKNLSYRALNFFREDISWASIDSDLLNTSWDMF